MQAMTVNQKVNKDAETMFNYFNQVGSITKTNIDSINNDLAQIKADAEAATSPAKADPGPPEVDQSTDDKIITLLGVEKEILPEWILSKLAKVVDQLLTEERKAKQTRAEGGNDTDMSSSKGTSNTSEPGQPKKKVRTSITSPPATKSKSKASDHIFFSSDDESEKMKVANAVAKIENAATRRRAAKEAKPQEKVKKGGKARAAKR